MDDTSEDQDFNPLIDEVQTDNGSSNSESSFSVEEQIIDLRQLVVNLREQIHEMAEVIGEFERKQEERETTIEVLRNTVRRLRFSATNSPDVARVRRDASFVDAARRKFLNRWDGQMDYFSNVQPEQLAFLAAVIDLPKEN